MMLWSVQCRVVQDIGKSHQPDMCQDTCSAQHQWFYVRVCPDRSHITKPGSKRKRRLDLKLDLSSSNCCDQFHDLLMLTAAHLEVKCLFLAVLTECFETLHMLLICWQNPAGLTLAGMTCWHDPACWRDPAGISIAGLTLLASPCIHKLTSRMHKRDCVLLMICCLDIISSAKVICTLFS